MNCPGNEVEDPLSDIIGNLTALGDDIDVVSLLDTNTGLHHDTDSGGKGIGVTWYCILKEIFPMRKQVLFLLQSIYYLQFVF